MADPPSGTVTFLFADIEDSTRLLHSLGDRYTQVIEDYRRLVRGIFQLARGYEEDPNGEGLFVAFPQAAEAVHAALAAQQAVTAASWPEGVTLRVRMGLHTGQPIVAGGGYIGLEVHRAARIASVGWGGQILLSQATADAVARALPAGAGVRDLGEHRLKDLQRREQIFQLLHPDLTSDFPPLRSLDTLPHNLPHQLTSFVGRVGEMDEVKNLLETHPIVTVVGPGGIGKTRLALQAAAEIVEEFPHGVWLAELAGLSDPSRIAAAVAVAVGLRVDEEGDQARAQLADHLQRRKLLLILDSCEHHATGCAQFAASVLQHCLNVKILATSWQPLALTAEAVVMLSPLTLPDPAETSPEQLVQAESIRLFVERAIAAQPSFALTAANAAAVAQISRQLEGHPLALELAAARLKVLSPEQTAARLADRFRLLTGGSRTAPPRHQSLRATMDWGYGLLTEPERILLQRLSVFQDPFTFEAATAVCADSGMEERDVAKLLISVVTKSFAVTEEGRPPRYRVPETVRQYAWEKLQQSGDAAAVQQRHRTWALSALSHA